MESQKVSFNNLDDLFNTLCNSEDSSTITFDALIDRLENYSINRSKVQSECGFKGRLPEFLTYNDLKTLTGVSDDKLKDVTYFDVNAIRNFSITNGETYKKFCKLVVKSLQQAPDGKHTFKWTTFNKPGAKQAQSNKSVYPQGSMFGVGTQSTGTLIIRGLKSGYVGVSATHDQALAHKVKDKISELAKDTENLKKTTQLQLTFDVLGADGLKQVDQVVEHMKLLAILKVLMCKCAQTAEKIDADLEVDYQGFLTSRIGKKFTNGQQTGTEWLWSFKCVAKAACMPNKKDKNGREVTNPYNVPVQIFRLEKENPLSLIQLGYSGMSSEQLSQMLRNQDMDIEVVIDSCGITQKGSTVTLTPKLRITKIFIKSRVQKQNQTFGLQVPNYITVQEEQVAQSESRQSPDVSDGSQTCDDDTYE